MRDVIRIAGEHLPSLQCARNDGDDRAVPALERAVTAIFAVVIPTILPPRGPMQRVGEEQVLVDSLNAGRAAAYFERYAK